MSNVIDNIIFADLPKLPGGWRWHGRLLVNVEADTGGLPPLAPGWEWQVIARPARVLSTD